MFSCAFTYVSLGLSAIYALLFFLVLRYLYILYSHHVSEGPSSSPTSDSSSVSPSPPSAPISSRTPQKIFLLFVCFQCLFRLIYFASWPFIGFSCDPSASEEDFSWLNGLGNVPAALFISAFSTLIFTFARIYHITMMGRQSTSQRKLERNHKRKFHLICVSLVIINGVTYGAELGEWITEGKVNTGAHSFFSDVNLYFIAAISLVMALLFLLYGTLLYRQVQRILEMAMGMAMNMDRDGQREEMGNSIQNYKIDNNSINESNNVIYNEIYPRMNGNGNHYDEGEGEDEGVKYNKYKFNICNTHQNATMIHGNNHFNPSNLSSNIHQYSEEDDVLQHSHSIEFDHRKENDHNTNTNSLSQPLIKSHPINAPIPIPNANAIISDHHNGGKLMFPGYHHYPNNMYHSPPPDKVLVSVSRGTESYFHSPPSPSPSDHSHSQFTSPSTSIRQYNKNHHHQASPYSVISTNLQQGYNSPSSHPHIRSPSTLPTSSTSFTADDNNTQTPFPPVNPMRKLAIIAGLSTLCLFFRTILLVTIALLGSNFTWGLTLLYFSLSEILPIILMLKVFDTPSPQSQWKEKENGKEIENENDITHQSNREIQIKGDEEREGDEQKQILSIPFSPYGETQSPSKNSSISSNISTTSSTSVATAITQQEREKAIHGDSYSSRFHSISLGDAFNNNKSLSPSIYPLPHPISPNSIPTVVIGHHIHRQKDGEKGRSSRPHSPFVSSTGGETNDNENYLSTNSNTNNDNDEESGSGVHRGSGENVRNSTSQSHSRSVHPHSHSQHQQHLHHLPSPSLSPSPSPTASPYITSQLQLHDYEDYGKDI